MGLLTVQIFHSILPENLNVLSKTIENSARPIQVMIRPGTAYVVQKRITKFTQNNRIDIIGNYRATVTIMLNSTDLKGDYTHTHSQHSS